MSEPLLTIGAFARAVGLQAHTEPVLVVTPAMGMPISLCVLVVHRRAIGMECVGGEV